MQTISSSNGHSSASGAQLEANRANSQLSTGPRSERGKARSSLNAVKNGLTGRTVLLPGDDAALYECHVSRFFTEFKPVGERETELVQSLTDAQWRMNRIPALEMGIYALARLNFKDMFAQEEPAVREALIQNSRTKNSTFAPRVRNWLRIFVACSPGARIDVGRGLQRREAAGRGLKL
jgi:hypothetical protein